MILYVVHVLSYLRAYFSISKIEQFLSECEGRHKCSQEEDRRNRSGLFETTTILVDHFSFSRYQVLCPHFLDKLKSR